MSADDIFNTAPYHIRLDETLSDAQQAQITDLLALLPAACVDSSGANHRQALLIKNIVDGRGLACPMPLLKTKVALRAVEVNQSLYVIATDPNSQADIVAFCQQTSHTNNAPQLLLTLNQATQHQDKQGTLDGAHASKLDTIFHFIITKTDSN